MQFFSSIEQAELSRLFYQKPIYFDQYSPRELLSYALGATLYMPATRKNLHHDILKQSHQGLTSLVMDLEDAVGDLEVEMAENNLVNELLKMYREKCDGQETSEDYPLLFIRIRSIEQFKRLKEQLGEALRLLTGVVLPKFSPESGMELLSEISQISSNEHPFYAMPILESEKIIKKETRMDELLKIKQLLDQHKNNILNVRIGATDFSGIYGLRRSMDTTVYDIAVLRDCIGDIINVFLRSDHSYVISGPVWEYFSSHDRILKPQLRQTPFQKAKGMEGLKWRSELIERNMDGFIREILLDIANGLTGKTIIHPSHINAVQALNVVSFEEYMDALNIIDAATGEKGVIKSLFSNKMNEIKPHYYWAKKMIFKSQLYGVLHEEYTSIDLIKKEVYV
jgi:citrate lyase beta subunit